MYKVNDQLGNELHFDNVPTRVISLVPSITYLLHSLDLESSVVGITRFCKFPQHYKNTKTIVGGTKEVKFEKIKQLNSDLFIISKEENTRELAETLQKIAPIYVADVFNCKTNKHLIQSLAQIFQKNEIADSLLKQIVQEKQILQNLRSIKMYKSLYFIWKNPWMTVGRDTFINEMMQLAGFQNIFADQKRYPIVDLSMISSDDIDIILLSSEPFPFKKKNQQLLQEQFPNTRIILVEGEPFTWFGAYPKIGFRYLTKLHKTITNAY